MHTFIRILSVEANNHKRAVCVTFMILAVIFLIGLEGCASALAPSKEELANMDYGQPLTINYQEVIQKYFNDTLIDPYSAHITISPESPKTFGWQESGLMGGNRYVGYAVAAKVNAKNRMGGYTGTKPYVFIFRDNALIKVLTPDELYLPTNGFRGM